MKIAAIAMLSYFDNVIHQAIVPVPDEAGWKDALVAAREEGWLVLRGCVVAWLLHLPDDLEAARPMIWEGEMDIVVTFYEGFDQ